ncbi:MAG: GTPase Era [Fimbriimonadaceae bacterium]|nr:GTPase Era [Fimbriimonadaceae bacterium]QYK55304.1 MAG: GTPase Era [Fimbriimonadaceae bacterium]
MSSFRAGLVAVVGKPNVGKSSLVNAVVGQKVSIVSDKAQTTRRRILGIASRPDWQIVFADTPGLHKPQHRLGAMLNETMRQSLSDVDLVLVMVDASRMPGKDDRTLAEMVASSQGAGAGPPLVLCLNKMDLLKAADVQSHYDAYAALFPTEHIMLTSVTREQNVDRLVELLVSLLPEGTPLYDPDEVTDQPMRELAAELVREKILRLTRQEVPHAVHVYVEEWDDSGDPSPEAPEPPRPSGGEGVGGEGGPEGTVHISMVVLVETEGQKAIVIGRGGQMLKKIGTEARMEIEEMLERHVFLQLFVKVRSQWRDNLRMLGELGLRT